jgi:RNA polymerase sigma-70 factor (ECF subfamily)
VAQTDESDAELVARVQRGDSDAFDRLARRYAKRAFAVANRMLQNAADAEDIVQDAFIAAVNAIDSFDPGRPFGPWFVRIVVNKSLTAIRSRAAEAKHVRGSELRESDAVAASAGRFDGCAIRRARRCGRRSRRYGGRIHEQR